MQGKSKNVLLIALVIGIVSMVVAYASLSTELRISSSAKVAATKWQIEITDWTKQTVSNLNGGTSEATVVAPTVTTTAITGLEVTFKKPGDAVQYTFNIKNKGDINAKLTSISGETETKDGVTKTVKCGSTPATPVAGNAAFSIAKNNGTTDGSLSCVLDISYNKDATTMPSTAQTVALTDVVFVYGQK